MSSTKEQYRAGLAAGDLKRELFEPYRASVEDIMEALLPDFGRSTYYRQACMTGRGVLWRVVKLARLTLTLIDQVLSNLVEPLLALCDKEQALDCVPHYSPPMRAGFREEVLRLQASLLALRGQLGLVCYIARRDCKHEEHQRLLQEHRKKQMQIHDRAAGQAHGTTTLSQKRLQ